jgi:hypothetical protein
VTYAEFSFAVRSAVFPDGAAENLVANHKNYVLDALIDLQTKCRCLQQNHVDYLCASSSFYHCGASVFEAPRGFIQSLSTMTPGDRCCVEISYTPVSKNDMDCMLDAQAAFSFCSTTELHPYDVYLQDGVYVPFPDTPLYCMDYVAAGDTSLDKTSRAVEGFFTIDRGQLWVNPRIQSDELVVLKWDGVKRSFADTDTVDEDIWTREVAECVELYVRGKAAGIDDCDLTRSIYYNNENMSKPGMYQIRRADLIHTCEKERRPPQRNYCYDTCRGGGIFLGASSSSSSSSSSTSTGVPEVYFGVGDPNGVQTATRPALFYTALGAMWFKTGTGTNDTGWELSIAGA